MRSMPDHLARSASAMAVSACETLTAEGVRARCGVDAVLGAVRAAEPGISRRRAAAVGDRPVVIALMEKFGFTPEKVLEAAREQARQAA